MPACAGLLEPRGSGLALLKSTLNAEKVIDVNKSKKPVTSACYDKQHVCTYLQPFSHYSSR